MIGRRTQLTLAVWLPSVAMFAAAWCESRSVHVSLRDPSGSIFALRLALAFAIFALFLVIDVLVRWRRSAASMGLRDTFRTRWTVSRLLLVASGLVAYHVTYVAYRNLKSWTALRHTRDAQLARADRFLFHGHDPAVLLHNLLGVDGSAHVLAFVYRSFGVLVPFTFVAALTFATRLRDGYAYLTSTIACWILGTATYYAAPTRGPFASRAHDFTSLVHTGVTNTQVHYLTERAKFLHHPHDPSTLNSISAFASLHVGYTWMTAMHLTRTGRRSWAVAAWIYLALVVVATLYFGWHFVADDIAGALLGTFAYLLGVLATRRGTVAEA